MKSSRQSLFDLFTLTNLGAITRIKGCHTGVSSSIPLTLNLVYTYKLCTHFVSEINSGIYYHHLMSSQTTRVIYTHNIHLHLLTTELNKYSS